MGTTYQAGFQGLDELKAALAEFPEKVARRLMRAGLKEAGQAIVEQAKANCPVAGGQTLDPDVEPGALRDAIRAYPQKKHRVAGQASVFVVSRPPYVHRGSKKTEQLDYGYWVEKGHFVARHHGGGAKAKNIAEKFLTWVPPQPYLVPAFMTEQNNVVQLMSDKVRKGIEAINRREAKKAAIAEIAAAAAQAVGDNGQDSGD